MGIVSRQATRITIYSYLGTVIGFVSVGIIFPKFLTTSQIGLINIIVAISLIFGQLGTLGFANVINIKFPLFRNKNNRHQGFSGLLLSVILIGSIISVLLLLFFKDLIVRQNIEDSNLLLKHYYLLVPATISIVIYNLLDTYIRVLNDAVIGTFIKEFMFRILVLILILSYVLLSFNFNWFIWIYVFIYVMPAITLVMVLVYRKELSVSNIFTNWLKIEFRSMTDIALYALIGGLGSIATVSVDKIMINKMLGLSDTGIYSIALLFGSIIGIPSNALGRSSYHIVTESWKNNDMAMINTVYKKSCLNQLIIGGLIFLLLWSNVDFIIDYLPKEYSKGIYVILFIALAQLFNMLTGINGVILVTSRYYRYHTYITGFLLIGLVFTNLMFIPIYGITGAALGSLITIVLTNLVRFVILYSKFRMQPFDYRIIIAILILLINYIISYYLPSITNDLLNVLFKSFIITVLYGVMVISVKLSSDINTVLRNFVNGITNK